MIKKYKFYKFIFIIKLYQILFDNNIVIFDYMIIDYDMFNFKIYLILNYDIFNSIILNDDKCIILYFY